MTTNESLKKYFKTLDESLDDINSEDEFYQVFLNSIKSGQNTFYQKLIRETRVFDDIWIKNLEAFFPSIDYIVRNPKNFIKLEKEVVAVERAKKINSDSVRHLSANTQFIREVTENGDVIPMKILTVFQEEDLAIYENRFVMSLINKLYTFVDMRYNAIVENMQSYQNDQLKVNSSFQWYRTNIDFELNINVKENINAPELEAKNNDLLERIKKLRSFAFSFKNSQFMKSLANAKPVRPPIMKTNILLKNIYYKEAYKLWIFLDMYDSLGFDVDIIEKNLPFEGSYIEDIYNVITASYTTMFVNQNLGELDYDLESFKKKRLKRPKVLKQISTDPSLKPDEYKIENNQINEYFFQQSSQLYSEKMESMVNNGVTKKEAFKNILTQLLNITNNMYEKFIEEQFVNTQSDEEDEKVDENKGDADEKGVKVDRIKKRKEKIKASKKKLDLIKLVSKVKYADYQKVLKEENKFEALIKKEEEKLQKAEQKALEARKKAELKKKLELEKRRAAQKAKKEAALKKKLDLEKQRAEAKAIKEAEAKAKAELAASKKLEREAAKAKALKEKATQAEIKKAKALEEKQLKAEALKAKASEEKAKKLETKKAKELEEKTKIEAAKKAKELEEQAKKEEASRIKALEEKTKKAQELDIKKQKDDTQEPVTKSSKKKSTTSKTKAKVSEPNAKSPVEDAPNNQDKVFITDNNELFANIIDPKRSSKTNIDIKLSKDIKDDFSLVSANKELAERLKKDMVIDPPPLNINDEQFKNDDKEGIDVDEFGNLTAIGLKEIRRRRLLKIEKERKKKEALLKKEVKK